MNPRKEQLNLQDYEPDFLLTKYRLGMIVLHYFSIVHVLDSTHYQYHNMYA